MFIENLKLKLGLNDEYDIQCGYEAGCLGYVPVTFNELTDDESFWKGCEGCINHDILVAKNRKFCICTAMLYDPKLHEEDKI